MFYLRPATPRTTRLSLVSVPVLSKQQISTFPAKGILKGSVQKTSKKGTRGFESNYCCNKLCIISCFVQVFELLFNTCRIGAKRHTQFSQGDERRINCQRELYGELWWNN